VNVDQISQLVLGGGAVGVFVLVFFAALRGELRFRPGVEGETRALREARDEARSERDYWRDHAAKLADAVDKLGDAVDRGNQRVRDGNGT
jgi:hypothetical protein